MASEPEISKQINMIIGKGFPRGEAIKIFFDNNNDVKYDPKASYNFDKDPNTTPNANREPSFPRRSSSDIKRDYNTSISKLNGLTKRIQAIGTNLMGTDHEVVDRALLLAQQEELYGVNMYDAITPEHEHIISSHVAEGLTRKEAILKIFEEKYGKVERASSRAMSFSKLKALDDTVTNGPPSTPEDNHQPALLSVPAHASSSSSSSLQRDTDGASAEVGSQGVGREETLKEKVDRAIEELLRAGYSKEMAQEIGTLVAVGKTRKEATEIVQQKLIYMNGVNNSSISPTASEEIRSVADVRKGGGGVMNFAKRDGEGDTVDAAVGSAFDCRNSTAGRMPPSSSYQSNQSNSSSSPVALHKQEHQHPSSSLSAPSASSALASSSSSSASKSNSPRQLDMSKYNYITYDRNSLNSLSSVDSNQRSLTHSQPHSLAPPGSGAGTAGTVQSDRENGRERYQDYGRYGRQSSSSTPTSVDNHSRTSHHSQHSHHSHHQGTHDSTHHAGNRHEHHQHYSSTHSAGGSQSKQYVSGAGTGTGVGGSGGFLHDRRDSAAHSRQSSLQSIPSDNSMGLSHPNGRLIDGHHPHAHAHAHGQQGRDSMGNGGTGTGSDSPGDVSSLGSTSDRTGSNHYNDIAQMIAEGMSLEQAINTYASKIAAQTMRAVNEERSPRNSQQFTSQRGPVRESSDGSRSGGSGGSDGAEGETEHGSAKEHRILVRVDRNVDHDLVIHVGGPGGENTVVTTAGEDPYQQHQQKQQQHERGGLSRSTSRYQGAMYAEKGKPAQITSNDDIPSIDPDKLNSLLNSLQKSLGVQIAGGGAVAGAQGAEDTDRPSSSRRSSLERPSSSEHHTQQHQRNHHQKPSSSSSNGTSNGNSSSSSVRSASRPHSRAHSRRPSFSADQRVASNGGVLSSPREQQDQLALAHGLLLSQQEAQFGVNMFDAIDKPEYAADIVEIVQAGFTRDAAVLMLFEKMYGRVAVQPLMSVGAAIDAERNLPSRPHSGLHREVPVRGSSAILQEQEQRQQQQHQQQNQHDQHIPGRTLSHQSQHRHSKSMPESEFSEEFVRQQSNPGQPYTSPPASTLASSAAFSSSSSASANHRGILKSQSLYRGPMETAEAREHTDPRPAHRLSRELGVHGSPPQRYSGEFPTHRSQLPPPPPDVMKDHYRYPPPHAPAPVPAIGGFASGPAGGVGTPGAYSSYPQQPPSHPYHAHHQRSKSGSGSFYYPSPNLNPNPNGIPPDHYGGAPAPAPAPPPYMTPALTPGTRSRSGSAIRRRSFNDPPGSTPLSIDPSLGAPMYDTPPPGADAYRTPYLGGAGSGAGDGYGFPVPRPSIPSPRTADDLALQQGIMLSQQEAEFGVNMYDAMTDLDEPEIKRLTAQGMSVDDAIFMIFEARYRPRRNDAASGGGDSPHHVAPAALPGAPAARSSGGDANMRIYMHQQQALSRRNSSESADGTGSQSSPTHHSDPTTSALTPRAHTRHDSSSVGYMHDDRRRGVGTSGGSQYSSHSPAPADLPIDHQQLNDRRDQYQRSRSFTQQNHSGEGSHRGSDSKRSHSRSRSRRRGSEHGTGHGSSGHSSSGHGSVGGETSDDVSRSGRSVHSRRTSSDGPGSTPVVVATAVSSSNGHSPQSPQHAQRGHHSQGQGHTPSAMTRARSFFRSGSSLFGHDHSSSPQHRSHQQQQQQHHSPHAVHRNQQHSSSVASGMTPRSKAKYSKHTDSTGRVIKYKHAHVETLMDMGFAEEQAIEALILSNDNVDEAASLLRGFGSFTVDPNQGDYPGSAREGRETAQC